MQVVKMCDAFKDHEVCILNGRESDDYQALENYALSLGATLTKTPAPVMFPSLVTRIRFMAKCLGLRV